MNRARNRVGFEYHYDAKIEVKILFFCDAFTFNALAGPALMGVKSPEWVDRSFFCGAVGRPWKPTTAPKKQGQPRGLVADSRRSRKKNRSQGTVFYE
jgi:hypothetical protein